MCQQRHSPAKSGSHGPSSTKTLAHFAAPALQSFCITRRMPDALFAIIISAYYLYNILQRDFQRLLNKEDGQRAQWEYPFAVAGLNLSFMMVELLDLKAGVCTSLRFSPQLGILPVLRFD
jgi:hypothetical protein